MTFIRRKRVGNRVYVYEMVKVKSRRGEWTQQIVRYLGPEDPVYGGKGPIVVEEERAKLASRKKRLKAREAA